MKRKRNTKCEVLLQRMTMTCQPQLGCHRSRAVQQASGKSPGPGSLDRSAGNLNEQLEVFGQLITTQIKR